MACQNISKQKNDIFNANFDQLNFIFNLMYGYNKIDLFVKKCKKKESSSLKNESVTQSRTLFYNTKINPRKGTFFFPIKFKRDNLKDRRDVLLNAMKLCNGRSKIINLFPANIRLDEDVFKTCSGRLQDIFKTF